MKQVEKKVPFLGAQKTRQNKPTTVFVLRPPSAPRPRAAAAGVQVLRTTTTILFAYAKTAALHSWVDVCEEVDQILGGFWQNLGDSWQNLASENATAFAKNNVKKS